MASLHEAGFPEDRIKLESWGWFGDDEELASRLDSLALLSLVVAVEDRFRILLTDEDATTARSLSDLARIVAARAPQEVAP